MSPHPYFLRILFEKASMYNSVALDAGLTTAYQSIMKLQFRYFFSGLIIFAANALGNVIFSDNFNDNSIDTTKWSTTGNTVIETAQIMEVKTAVTDQPGTLTSSSFAINSTSVITITRNVLLHHDTPFYYQGNNRFFVGQCVIHIGTLPIVRICYDDYDYSGPYDLPKHGFFVTRNDVGAHSRSRQSDVSAGVPAIWDTWFTETISYNPVSGQLQYYINGTLQITFNVGSLPASNSPTMTLQFQAYGWWTTHYQYMDNLVVAQDPNASITFYHQSGGLLGAVGAGHAFLAIRNKNGASLFAGFYCDNYQYYFANIPEIGFSGYIHDDQNTAWDYKISYPITDTQYSSALAVIAHDQQLPPRYWLAGFNCMDWVVKVATAAGIQLPQYKYLYTAGFTISDPLIFYASLSSLGNGTTYMGGTVTSNQSPAATLLSASSAVATPIDYSYSALESAGHADPASLATSIGIPYHHVNLGTVNANSVNGLSLSLTGADANFDVISIKWGDGSALQEQSATFSHVYSAGTYAAQLLVIDAGGVHSYDMTVVVSSATAAAVTVNVTPSAPVNIPNQGLIPASLGPNFLIMQATSISVLGNGHAVAKFLGIPTLTYTIQATSDLNQGFLPAGSATADADGTFQYDDPTAVSAGSRFYRATYP